MSKFTSVSGSNGYYRHTASGILMYPVNTVEELVEANGAIAWYEDAGDDAYVWLAGQDLQSVIKGLEDNAVTVSQESIANAMLVPKHEGGLNFHQRKGDGLNVSYRHFDYGSIQARPIRICAVRNKLYAGRGEAGLRSGSPFGTNPAPAYYGSTLGAPWTDTLSWAVSGDNQFTDVDQPKGVVVVAMPIAPSWDEAIDAYLLTIENYSKSEVQAELAPKIEMLRNTLEKYTPGPVMYVPLAMNNTGSWRILLPKAAENDPLVSNSTGGHLNNSIHFMPMLGSCASDDNGHPSTMCAGPHRTGQGTSAPHLAGLSYPTPITWGNSEWVEHEGIISLSCSKLAGVELGQYLGGVTGISMLDDGTFDGGVVDRTRDELLALYKAAITQPVGDDTYDLGNYANETERTDALTLAGTAWTGGSNEYDELSFNQWDTHGFSLNHGAMLMSMLGNISDYDLVRVMETSPAIGRMLPECVAFDEAIHQIQAP